MAFQGIGIDQPCGLVNTNTATAFSTESATSIFDSHELFREVAFLEVKIERVQAYEFSK